MWSIFSCWHWLFVHSFGEMTIKTFFPLVSWVFVVIDIRGILCILESKHCQIDNWKIFFPDIWVAFSLLIMSFDAQTFLFKVA